MIESQNIDRGFVVHKPIGSAEIGDYSLLTSEIHHNNQISTEPK